jgi:hypothetical protein
MPKRNCAKMSPGCPKAPNTFHKCKKKVSLTSTQDRQVIKGGRIDGKLFTDYCEGHVCQFCNKKFTN